MKLSSELNQKIVEFLTSLPNINDNTTQRALIESAGLDPQLQNQISFTGASTQFFQMLVPTLIRYGVLKDGRNALEAVLRAAKHSVGQDRKTYCDELIRELRISLKDIEAKMKYELKFDETIDEEFLRSLKHWEEISSIDIIAHTGRHIVRGFLDHIKANHRLQEILEGIEIRILLRNPGIETKRRSNLISQVVQDDIKYFQDRGYKIQVCFYQNLPIFRGIVYNRHEPYKRIAYIGFYYFPLNSTSQRFSHAFVIDEEKTGKSPLIELMTSWFEHFWGKTKKTRREIHTIIFDFDDTIVDSHTMQIQAWIKTIKEYQKELPQEAFQENVRNNLNNHSELWKEIEIIFFKEQHATSIFNRIFHEEHLRPEQVDEIHQRRFKIRESNVKNAKLFEGCIETIQAIADKYHLIIISATDEDMITEYLSKQTYEDKYTKKCTNLLKPFLHVFGKKEPIFDWQNLNRKTQLILKVINVLGVPVERLVYVGDNDNDFKSCQQIGIDFIEARLFREESLVKSDEPREFFTDWKDFPKALEKIEQQKQLRFSKMFKE